MPFNTFVDTVFACAVGYVFGRAYYDAMDTAFNALIEYLVARRRAKREAAK